MNTRRGQPVRFVVVGIGGFLLNISAFSVLHELGSWYVLASILAYLISNAAMYLGNRYFTFGLSHDGFIAAYARYVLVGTLVAGLTVVLLAVLVEGLRLDPLPAQALALALLVPLSFLLSKRVAFRLHPDAA